MSEESSESLTPFGLFNRKISIWRRTFLLFHKYRFIDDKEFEGPFYSSGYRDYVVDRVFIKKDSTKDILKPDIFSWDNNRGKGLIVEVTTNPNNLDDKKIQMEKYAKYIDTDSAKQYGANITDGHDVILSHMNFYENDQNDFCELELDSDFKFKNILLINDNKLKESLENFEGSTSLINAPEISISLIPEMKKKNNVIKVGLLALIMSFFKKGVESKTAEEFTDSALERLSDLIDPADKNELIEIVNSELMDLADRYLPEYMTYNKKDKTFSKTENGEKIFKYFTTKKSVKTRLLNWVNDENPAVIPKDEGQSTLSTFGEGLSDPDFGEMDDILND